MAKSAPPDRLDGNIIADTSIRQPVFITMIMVLTVVIGGLAYLGLPVNLLPDFNIPIVAVTVQYPGAGPQSVADQVTEPLEETINTINGVKHITSNSSEGIAQIIVEFEAGSPIDQAEQDVREKINAVVPRLPRDVRAPVFSKFDPNDQAILTVSVASAGASTPLELRQLVDSEIVPRLQRIAGVGSITVNGGQVRQLNVLMDLNKLTSHQVLPVQITGALRAANNSYGLGTVGAGDRDVSLRAPSQIQEPADIERIQITGTAFRIGDVARVEDGVADVTSYARLDGKDAITLAVRKQSGTNTISVAEAVKTELNTIFAAQPDLNYFIPNDQANEVRSSVDSAIEELLLASLAAMLIVLLFFRDLRNTIVTVAGLPVILIGTFAALQLFGLSLNLITLLALSLSVGLVIDDAIVVRENIFRHMERGETPRVASSRGTAEVALSVLAMTLTIISVFLPVTFTEGITGVIFKSFGITVAAAMALSLVEAFTLAPMLSAYLFKQKLPHGSLAQIATRKLKGEPQHSSSLEETVEPVPSTLSPQSTEHSHALLEAEDEVGVLGRFYERVLRWGLRRRWLVMAAAVAVFVLSGLVATQLKFSFFPAQDNHTFTVQFELPPGTPLAETDRLAKQAEQVMLNDDSIAAVISTVGFAGNPERASFFVKLAGKTPTLEGQAALRPQLNFLPKVAFGQPSFQGSSADVTGRALQLSVQTTRPIEEITPVLLGISDQAASIPGLIDIDSTYKPGKPELRFYADPTKTGNLGITNDDIATSVRALINGDRATVFREDGQDIDVVVRLAPGDRASTDDLRGITVPTRNGSVPLSSLVQIEAGASPATIRRYDRLNQVLIGANVEGRTVGEVQADIQARVDQLRATIPQELSSDIFISFGGAQQSQQEGFTTLFIAMGLSVLFVYMVLASQFGSFLQPLVIMLAMPFSFIGAFVALIATGTELDITGMIGLIMLLGLVTKNSILLVDFTNNLRKAGMPKYRAIERAGAVRLRPIIMTTLAIVVGALPTAFGIHFFSSGDGGEFRRGLAIVLIGGLLTSMILTLLVVPVAYSLLDSLTSWASSRLRRERVAAVPAVVGEPSGSAD
ncbi:MAG: efflux RND transporter permease subunit [Roseiflexaceae bacterium]|nr:efflux RND transporter permease subunit [Roseiflexaceae bacterium]